MRTNAERFGKGRRQRVCVRSANILDACSETLLAGQKTIASGVKQKGGDMPRIVTAIWNGPFYIGKLTQPTTVGDVLAKVLETLWRAVIAIIALVIGTIMAILVWTSAIQPVFFPPAKSKLTAFVLYDDGKTVTPPVITLGDQASYGKPQCNSAYPLKLVIVNHGRKAITKIHFSIQGYENDSSRDVLSDAYYLGLDSIISPNGGWHWQCYSAAINSAANPSTLRYVPEILDAEYN